jgi:hypothetical protein
MKFAGSMQVASSLLGFSITPAIWGATWGGLPEAMRWTVFASQIIMMISGFLFAKALRAPQSRAAGQAPL